MTIDVVTHARRRRTSSAPWVDIVAAILAGLPKLDGARCVGRADVFDGTDADTRATAVALCQRCPALPACSAWVASLPKTKTPPGVVGGVYRSEWAK